MRDFGFERNGFLALKKKKDLEAKKPKDLQVYPTLLPTFGDYTEDLEGGG